jgi:hypothetical protein
MRSIDDSAASLRCASGQGASTAPPPLRSGPAGDQPLRSGCFAAAAESTAFDRSVELCLLTPARTGG